MRKASWSSVPRILLPRGYSKPTSAHSIYHGIVFLSSAASAADPAMTPASKRTEGLSGRGHSVIEDCRLAAEPVRSKDDCRACKVEIMP